jgi:hypothetical protein
MVSNIDSKYKLTNGAILIISTILRHVMSSAAEAEIGSVFLNANEATILRTNLEEMGHPQPPTPLKTDNTTVMGYSNDTIKQRRTRAMDVGFIGSQIESNKVSYVSIGARNTKMWPITSQKIIHEHITNGYERCIYTRMYDQRTTWEFEITGRQVIHPITHCYYVVECNQLLSTTNQYRISYCRY